MSLRNKILLAVSISLLLFTGAVLLSVTYITRRSFSSYLSEQERREAAWLVPQFEQWYAQNGSWRGVETLLNSRGRRMMRGNSRQMTGRAGRAVSRIVLTDPELNVIYDNLSIAARQKMRSEGIAVTVAGQVTGYLYIGGMTGQGLSAVAVSFLREVSFFVILTAFFLFLATLFFLSLATRKMLVPLTLLSRNARQVGRGNYDAVIPLSAGAAAAEKDEILAASLAFNQMAGELREREAWRDRLLNNISHELRTPLTLLRGKLEMIREGVKKPDKPTIDSLYGETDILLTLAEEVRRAGKEKEEQIFVPLNIKKLPEEARLRYASRFKEAKIRFLIKGGGAVINGDRTALLRLFSNLTDNALKYLPDDGSGQIDVRIKPAGKKVVVFYQDNGPGIPVSQREKVFERFYRIDQSRNRQSGGRGLGLSICREIARRHGGDMDLIASQSGEGACFRIEFPVTKG